ncbi:hypothetical protein [Burkholderia aenigmatica]|uniref:hypothetical protein n=1 Tax=Burkholderia aenigmatica TaxID=2015348 RepID=UPI001583513A|nr:hypothetical protein [Burkholderia aenigmatica]
MGKIDFLRVVVDSSSIRAIGAGEKKAGPNPTDQARLEFKFHLVTDVKGTPIVEIPTGADRNGVT